MVSSRLLNIVANFNKQYSNWNGLHSKKKQTIHVLKSSHDRSRVNAKTTFTVFPQRFSSPLFKAKDIRCTDPLGSYCQFVHGIFGGGIDSINLATNQPNMNTKLFAACKHNTDCGQGLSREIPKMTLTTCLDGKRRHFNKNRISIY